MPSGCVPPKTSRRLLNSHSAPALSIRPSKHPRSGSRHDAAGWRWLRWKAAHFVRKGTTVLWYVYAMHRRADIFGDDAEDFRPERWDGLRPGWGFLPFNGGPRICIGREYSRFSPSSPCADDHYG